MRRGKRVFITGSTGLLGLSLMNSKPAGIVIYAGYYNFPHDSLPDADIHEYIPIDIRDRADVVKVFKKIRPDVVIHAASQGSVDYCERNREEAWRTNVEGSRDVIEACRVSNIKLIFTSSNAVFDGEQPPYKEDDRPNPVDYYGQTKLQTEQDILKGQIDYAIVRLMTMYGWNHPLERQNPVTWVLGKLKKGEKINIVNDIYNNHLYVDNAAQAIWAVIEKAKQGIYHIAGGEVVSRYSLACAVADIFGFDKDFIKPVDSSFFPAIAPRPKNTSYTIDKMEQDLSVKATGIQEGLHAMKANPPTKWSYDWF